MFFFHVVTLIKISFSCEIKELSPTILLKTYLVESQIVVIMFFFFFLQALVKIYILVTYTFNRLEKQAKNSFFRKNDLC